MLCGFCEIDFEEDQLVPSGPNQDDLVACKACVLEAGALEIYRLKTALAELDPADDVLVGTGLMMAKAHQDAVFFNCDRTDCKARLFYNGALPWHRKRYCKRCAVEAAFSKTIR